MAETCFESFRFRLYPTTEQQKTLEVWQHAQRALWNAANAQRMERLSRHGYDVKRGKRYLSAYDQHAELTECRREYDWLRDVPQMLQHDLLIRLDRAWEHFFVHGFGLPRYKRKTARGWTAMCIRARECALIARGRIRFPKLGILRFQEHRRVRGRPLRVAIMRDIDQWFMSVVCEVTREAATPPSGEPIGIDVGVKNVLSDSCGLLIANPRAVGDAVSLRRAQRTAARRRPDPGQKASNNYLKAVRKIALLHRRVRRKRADFLHNLSSHYAKRHGTVVIEDLKVTKMTKSAKGTKDKPGKNVRQKAGLNREILGAGWGELRRQLTYKCEWYGSKLIVVDPKYTSQACQQCGCVDRGSRATQMLFMCVECGFIDHADVNAAKNILDRGIGPAGATTVAACGGFDGSRPMKQEDCLRRLSENDRSLEDLPG